MRITDSHFAFNANHKQQKKEHTHTLTHIKKFDYKRHSAVLQHSPVFYQNKTGNPYPSRQFEAHTYMSMATSRKNMITLHAFRGHWH